MGIILSVEGPTHVPHNGLISPVHVWAIPQRVAGRLVLAPVLLFLLVKVEFIETEYSTTRKSSPPAPVGSLYYRGPEGSPVAE